MDPGTFRLVLRAITAVLLLCLALAGALLVIQQLKGQTLNAPELLVGTTGTLVGALVALLVHPPTGSEPQPVAVTNGPLNPVQVAGEVTGIDPQTGDAGPAMLVRSRVRRPNGQFGSVKQ